MSKVAAPSAVVLLHILAVTGGFFLLVLSARRRAKGAPIFFVLLLSSWLIAPRFEPRPETFSVLFAAAFIFFLASERKGWLLWAILLPIQILWANTSMNFQLGFFIALAFTIENALARRKNAATSETPASMDLARILLPVGVLAASAVSPFALGNLGVAISHWTDPTSLTSSLYLSPYQNWFMHQDHSERLIPCVLGIGACGLIFFNKRLPLGITLAAVFGVLIAITREDLVIPISILCFCFLCLSMQTTAHVLATKATGKPEGLATVGIATGVLLTLATIFLLVSNSFYVLYGTATQFGLGANEEIVPASAMSVINRDDMPDKILNSYIDGGYLAINGKAKIFFDQRTRLYGKDLFTEFDNAFNPVRQKDEDPKDFAKRQGAQWTAFDEKWNPTVMVLNTTMANSARRLNSLLNRKWIPAYFDGSTMILAQKTPETQALIDDMEIKEAGLKKIDEARMAYRKHLQGGLVKAPVPARLIGAAHIFHSLGHTPLAHELNTLLTCGAPNLVMAWQNKGLCEIQLGKKGEAVKSLAKANELQPGNLQILLPLYQAYSFNGMEKRAEGIYQQIKPMNPEAATWAKDAIKKAKHEERKRSGKR
jgi:tetratricopeptide (TPR) repeat protein